MINLIVGNKASTRCPMWLETSHQFCNLEDDFKPVESSLRYDLGLLHCENNTFEDLLNLSYRKSLQLWDYIMFLNLKMHNIFCMCLWVFLFVEIWYSINVRKYIFFSLTLHFLIFIDQFTNRKLLSQKNIYDNFEVRVDQILQWHGTTNTGNVSRRCFQEQIKFARTLEINEELVSSVALILLALKYKKEIKLDELEKFCWETYCHYYRLYLWAIMSTTLHKL